MVEIQLSKEVPEELLITFCVCTTLLVAVHMLALLISTCILPHIEAVTSMPCSISESPHEKLHWYIETAWAFSTVFGILLFLLEIAILCWVKFYEYSFTAAWCTTIVLFPVVLILLAFAIHFYRTLVAHKFELSKHGLRELESLANRLHGDSLDRNSEHSVLAV
uniref:Calcium release-activated calcium channel protein 1 n=2 Tax=Parasteatoda tepidariorum TaxID=114398 RepID=A0A2L2YQR7_PARTP